MGGAWRGVRCGHGGVGRGLEWVEACSVVGA